MDVNEIIILEERRQADTLQMIPSENYTSLAVKTAMGSIMSNKYAEGYPGKRYYQGNIYVDEIERLARDRANQMKFDIFCKRSTNSARLKKLPGHPT